MQQATIGVPNSPKANLQIAVRDTNPSPVVPVVPVAPINLVARGLDTGTNTLAWNRAANRFGTLFVLEAKINPDKVHGNKERVSGGTVMIENNEQLAATLTYISK